MLERLADLTRTQNVKDGFEANSDMLSISGTRMKTVLKHFIFLNGFQNLVQRAKNLFKKIIVNQRKIKNHKVINSKSNHPNL